MTHSGSRLPRTPESYKRTWGGAWSPGTQLAQKKDHPALERRDPTQFRRPAEAATIATGSTLSRPQQGVYLDLSFFDNLCADERHAVQAGFERLGENQAVTRRGAPAWALETR